MRYGIAIAILLLFSAFGGYAQATRMVKQGNKLYEQKKYSEAGNAYMQALSKNPTYTPGMFNLGNALYQQKQYEGARKVLDNAVKIDTNRAGKAAANYNIGNTYMAEKKWEEAIDAYKKTLRMNPQDADAKYNLSYAQQMLKKQGGGGNKNDKDKKDDKQDDKKENKKGQDKEDDNKNEQNKDQQNKDDKKDEQGKQPQQSKLSEKQAEQLLNALQQEEKKLQDKHKKVKGVPVKVEKDW